MLEVLTKKQAQKINIKNLYKLPKFYSIFKFGRNNENLNKKKWVRNVENDNIVNSNKNNLLTLEMSKKATNQSTKDTINEGK